MILCLWLCATPETERLQLSLACLRDAAETGCLINHALREALAHLVWYRKIHPSAPVEISDVFWSKFYADNAAVRLYPATKDVAEFIIEFLSIDRQRLREVKKKRQTSAASNVGAYLKKHLSQHSLTALLLEIGEEPRLQGGNRLPKQVGA